MKLRNKKGFTIVELVIVIGVIGILSAILIPTFVSLTDKAEKSAIQSNLANAYSMYAADAADGFFGEEGVDGKAVLLYSQEQIGIKKVSDTGDKYYFYGEKGWSYELSATLPSTYDSIKALETEDNTQVQYSGYLFYCLYNA